MEILVNVAIAAVFFVAGAATARNSPHTTDSAIQHLKEAEATAKAELDKLLSFRKQ